MKNLWNQLKKIKKIYFDKQKFDLKKEDLLLILYLYFLFLYYHILVLFTFQNL